MICKMCEKNDEYGMMNGFIGKVLIRLYECVVNFNIEVICNINI